MTGAKHLPAYARTQLPPLDCDATLGNTLIMDGVAPQGISIYGAVAYVRIAPEGGDVYYQVNGVLAGVNAPGYVPQNGVQTLGPIANFNSLSLFSDTADTAVHVQFCRHEGQPGHVFWSNWWDPFGEGLCVWAAYQPKGAPNFAASLYDISGNGNDAIDPGGAATPAWNAVDGWVFDGTGDYLITTFRPDIDQSQSALVQYTDVVSNYLFGSDNWPVDNGAFFINLGIPGNWNFANGLSMAGGVAVAAGNLGIAGANGYQDGVFTAGPVAAWPGIPLHDVYIGIDNYGAVDYGFLTGKIQAVVFYSCVLTPQQMAAVATAMAAL